MEAAVVVVVVFLAGELESESEESEALSLVPGLAMSICKFLSARGSVLEEEGVGELVEGGAGEEVVVSSSPSKDLSESPTASFGILFGLASIHLMIQR